MPCGDVGGAPRIPAGRFLRAHIGASEWASPESSTVVFEIPACMSAQSATTTTNSPIKTGSIIQPMDHPSYQCMVCPQDTNCKGSALK
jgi:hypothetical protein